MAHYYQRDAYHHPDPPHGYGQQLYDPCHHEQVTVVNQRPEVVVREVKPTLVFSNIQTPMLVGQRSATQQSGQFTNTAEKDRKTEKLEKQLKKLQQELDDQRLRKTEAPIAVAERPVIQDIDTSSLKQELEKLELLVIYFISLPPCAIAVPSSLLFRRRARNMIPRPAHEMVIHLSH